ncbi:MAG: pseudaminic acid biosynthesis-associated methylase [Thermodesulfobacteriota bacterium]
MTTEQIEVWTGEFGRAYTNRNRFEDDAAFNAFYIKRYGLTRDAINSDWLGGLAPDAPILEVGANIGNQLRALRRAGFQRLFGIEIQRYCVEQSKQLNPEVDIIEGSAFDIPFKDGFFNLVYTNNVLIHISPADLPKVMDEMYRVSGRYIWGFEYFAPEPTEINYRGHKNLLWKADYAALFMARFPDLKLVRQQLFDCLDEAGTIDKLYLLEKSR